eukprot:13841251-Alexandrium_andersonii.AAC.1
MPPCPDHCLYPSLVPRYIKPPQCGVETQGSYRAGWAGDERVQKLRSVAPLCAQLVATRSTPM